MKATLKPVEAFYQPPRMQRTCRYPGCNVKISSVNKTGLCRRHAAMEIGKKTGGWNKGLKKNRRDE